MSKKHFIALADVIIFAKRNGTPWPHYVVLQLASFLREQNPRFNEDRWLGYINGDNGPSGGRVKH